MGWPGFRKKQWLYLKDRAKEKIIPAEQPTVFAFDRDKKVVDSLSQCIQDSDLIRSIQVSPGDFIDLTPESLTGKKGLVVINPPFGRRLGTKNESDRRFIAMCDKLQKDFRGWKIGLIVPNKNLIKKLPFRLESHTISHGGLKLMLLTGTL